MKVSMGYKKVGAVIRDPSFRLIVLTVAPVVALGTVVAH